MTYRPTVLVDFDGVIHAYTRGWDDGEAYDPPIEGAKEHLKAIEEAGYDVVIFSTRDRDQIRAWLQKWEFESYDVTNEKRPALCMIDDRAIRFSNWDDALYQLLQLYPIRETRKENR